MSLVWFKNFALFQPLKFLLLSVFWCGSDCLGCFGGADGEKTRNSERLRGAAVTATICVVCFFAVVRIWVSLDS